MCTSILHIYPKNYLGMSLDVPCGQCLECRSLSQNSWVTRLGFDLRDLYSRGGVAVFLTFTYNNECLPYSNFGFVHEKRIPVFQRKDELKFLNELKVYVYRKYGKGSYKYFFCAEYGKFTKRPHYHGLFMLEPHVDPTWFAEKCRQLWDYGFMFPRRKNDRYVDNNGATSSVTLRNLQGACKYVSKYITKDIDYYDLPLVKKYIEMRHLLKDEERKYYNDLLPKHLQSKGIGSSLLKGSVSPALLDVWVKNGIYNPTTCKVDQLPRYYVEKLCFDHKRIVVDGMPKVLRSLNHDYYDVVKSVLEQSFRARINQVNNFFLNLDYNYIKNYGYSISDFVRLNRIHRDYSTEYIVCRSFYDRLTTTCKVLFDKLYGSLSLSNVVSFRMDLYDLEVDTLFSKDVSIDSDVAFLMSVFSTVTKGNRAIDNKKRYDDYIRQIKLKFIQLHLIN